LCATPGNDGPTTGVAPVNTYFPPLQTSNLNSGATSLFLQGVPPVDQYGNSFGVSAIKAGDLFLVIQMQDGSINNSNSELYGANNATSGFYGLGGTGYTSLGNAGLYEYAIALNNVPLSGGTLNFKAAGVGGGLVNSYVNSPGNGISQGKKTFQIVRIPQLLSLLMLPVILILMVSL
jgi:hypothetical protein